MAEFVDKNVLQARLRNSFMGLNPAYQSTVQEEADRMRRAELNRNRQMALRDDSSLREAESQKTVVLDPSITSMRYGAEGLNPANFGVEGTDETIQETVAVEESGPSVDQMTGRSDDGMTGRFLLRRALENSRTPIDMQRFDQLAQDRNRAGDLSTLTSLYANEAGPRYDDYKKSYLTKAREEQGQQQLGDYGIASGGEFYETPGIQQGRETQADFDAADLLFDAENDRLARELAERRYDSNIPTPGERQYNARELGKLDELARTAYQTLRAIPTMEQAQGKFYQGIFANSVNEINRLMSLTGDEAAGQRVAARDVAEGLANGFGIAKLSDIGGNDTERELMIAISTTFGMTNRPEANRTLLKLLRDTATWNVDRAQAAKRWSKDYNTLNGLNDKRQTFDEYYEEQRPANKDRGKYLPGSESGSAGQNTYEVNF